MTRICEDCLKKFEDSLGRRGLRDWRKLQLHKRFCPALFKPLEKKE